MKKKVMIDDTYLCTCGIDTVCPLINKRKNTRCTESELLSRNDIEIDYSLFDVKELKSKVIKEAKQVLLDMKTDNVNHPPHYTSHPSGIECIEITRHYSFSIGNAIKYLWRAGLKENNELEDLNKAKWYIEDRIKQIENETISRT